MGTKDILITILDVGATMIAGYSIYRSNKVEKKIDAAVDQISNGLNNIDIPDSLIKDAVERAVEKHSKIAASSAVVQIRGDILEETQSEVKRAYGDVKDEVKRELKNKVGDVNLDDIRKEIIGEAKEAAKDKFDDDLDDILKEYNDKLKSIGKIYDSIADSLSNRKSSGSDGMTLKIGG